MQGVPAEGAVPDGSRSANPEGSTHPDGVLQRGAWDNDKLEDTLQEIVMSSNNRDALDRIEFSQLTLAFNKIMGSGTERGSTSGCAHLFCTGQT